MQGTVVYDPVKKPRHYNIHPSGVECIQVTEHFNFCVGNAIKYLWRCGIKSPNALEDLEKAKWYIEREIKRLGGGMPVDTGEQSTEQSSTEN